MAFGAIWENRFTLNQPSIMRMGVWQLRQRVYTTASLALTESITEVSHGEIGQCQIEHIEPHRAR